MSNEVIGFLEEKDRTPRRLGYYEALEAFFDTDPQSSIAKLIDFPKYVPNNAVARFLARYEIFKLCLDVHGCVVECGVLSGAGVMTFAHVSSILEPYNQGRKIVGFDTFEGFPHVADQDRAGSSAHLVQGAYAGSSEEDIRALADIHNGFRLLSREEQVELVKGDILATVPAYVEVNPHTVVSLLYLDCDLYQPTKVALEIFLPRMPKGAVLVFDELHYKEFPGETTAVLETVGLSRLRIRRLPYTKISYAVLE